MLRFPERTLVLAAIVALSCGLALGEQTPPSPSEAAACRADPAVLARQYVEPFVERTRLAAGNALLKEEIGRLAEPKQPEGDVAALADELRKADPETGNALAVLLASSAKPVNAQLASLLEETRVRRQQSQDAWAAVRRAVVERRLALPEAAAAREAAATLGAVLSLDRPGFWAVGLLAPAVLLGVVAHARRHQVRRWLARHGLGSPKASRLACLAATSCAALLAAGCLAGMGLYSAPRTADGTAGPSPLEAIHEENQAITAESTALRDSRRALQEKRAQVLARSHGGVEQAPASGLAAGEESREFRAAAMELAEELAVLRALPAAIEADSTVLEALDAQVADHARSAAGLARLRSAARAGAGLSLLALTLAGARLHRRALARRRQRTGRTCPACLGRNRLVRVPGANGGPQMVRCRNVLRESPREECGYTMPDAYRSLTRLGFPLLGVPQAGKTHWLAMLCWEISRRCYPPALQLEKARFQGSEDLDAKIESILRSRIGPAATPPGRIPDPVVLHLRDRDPLGRSSALVDLFDYSGEATCYLGVEDPRRRRALCADGFLYFLDPTYPHEPQARALAALREDLRVLRGVEPGGRVAVPVALCLSKIDLLAGQGYGLPDGDDAIARFYGQLAQIDPGGDAASRHALEARSRLTAGLQGAIWPGWQVQRQVDDLFGPQHRFFPLTPVGLDGRGERDLGLRTIAPFGLLEPLLWLLEMNGYRVLH